MPRLTSLGDGDWTDVRQYSMGYLRLLRRAQLLPHLAGSLPVLPRN